MPLREGTLEDSPTGDVTALSSYAVPLRQGEMFPAIQLISDLNGNLLFENRVHQTVTLNRSTDTYHAVWVAEFVDPAGNVVAVFEGTAEARRITTEPHTNRPEGQ